VRRYRQRQRAGLAVYPVEVGADVLDMLVRLGWLADGEAGDAAQVSSAIAALLAATAKNM
jgi:deoxyribose-phosphate aldolase